MDLKLNKKKAVVLGGTRGIGRAIVESLLAEGADVAFCARNAEQVTSSVAELSGKGGKVIGGSVDISDGEALKRWVTEAGAELGGIDILISNASALAQGSDPASWQACLDIDILGLQNATEAALPMLEDAAKAHGDAAIITIGSVSSTVSSVPSAYGAMKGAMIHLVKGMARQYAPKHIRANVVSPGAVYFEGGVWHHIEINDPQLFEATKKRYLGGRMATPEDIADAAIFLASPRSSHTTGMCFQVDGSVTDRVNY